VDDEADSVDRGGKTDTLFACGLRCPVGKKGAAIRSGAAGSFAVPQDRSKSLTPKTVQRGTAAKSSEKPVCRENSY